MSTNAICSEESQAEDSVFLPSVRESESPTAFFNDFLDQESLSPWVRSRAKRVFDVALVLAMLPFLLPLFLAIVCAVRLTSKGPALFLQKRVGRNGTLFTIYKFRTMTFTQNRLGSITTVDDPAITKFGKFLRWWKLDEMPQFINVLRGEMSLVGPRPKVPEQKAKIVSCRPGITGAATIAFAQEEVFLAGTPEDQLEEYFRTVLLPLKHALDASYMANATLFSDLRLLCLTAIRRWSWTDTTLETLAMDISHKPSAATDRPSGKR